MSPSDNKIKNKKIAVYYIATGEYKMLFPDFLESVQNFFPDCEKKIKLISDGLEEYSTYEKGKVKVELCPRISHYPWPIVTLYKMWHILENADSSCEYACYINSNAIINIHSNEIFDFDKITTAYHSFNSKNREYDPWPYISINPNSCAYLENGTYDYVQAAFFFGPSNLIYKMCSEINEMVLNDTRRMLFAQWHDESYLNKWCVINFDIVDKKYIMTVYKDEIDFNRFIYLRDKNDYFIKKF